MAEDKDLKFDNSGCLIGCSSGWEKDYNGNLGAWRTNENGEHYFIRKGETLKDANNRFLSLKKGRQNPSYSDILNIGKFPKPERALGFADKERLNTGHHLKHAIQMGYRNSKEYEKAACDFFNKGKGKVYFGLKRGRFFKYDGKRLLCVSSHGIIHTFYEVSNKKFKGMIKEEKLCLI